MDAITLLWQDHLNAKKLMEEIVESAGPARSMLFNTLKRELEIHNHIEESIFYPAVESTVKTRNFGALDKNAHQAVERSLERLSKMSVHEAAWLATFKDMQKRLLQHVADEEENLFPRIREAIGAATLSTLGEKMKAEKERGLKLA